MKTIAILTSGGDSPGMNAALRAAVKVAAGRGVQVLGVRMGYEGLVDGAFRPLTRASGHAASGLAPDAEVDAANHLGGTLLGSARSLRFRDPAGRAAAAAKLREAGAEGLIVIGGNGSLAGADVFGREHGVPVLGLPASIDNDIGCTGSAIGVDTALNTIVEACDRISDTARAHRRAFVVEVMGRQCGYLAMASSIAAGADAALFREKDLPEEEVVRRVADVIRRGFAPGRDKQRVLIVKAEGVEVSCTRLVQRVEESLAAELPGLEVRATVLGHLVRGGNPSFQDRMIGGRLALAAVEALLSGARGEMVGWQAPVEGGTPTNDPSVRRFDLPRVLRETEALIDGSSPVTRRRVRMMEAVEGVLAL